MKRFSLNNAKHQGFSRVTTRPAGRIRRFSKTARGRVGLGQGAMETSRVGPRRVRRFSILLGWVRVSLTPPDPREVISPVKESPAKDHRHLGCSLVEIPPPASHKCLGQNFTSPTINMSSIRKKKCKVSTTQTDHTDHTRGASPRRAAARLGSTHVRKFRACIVYTR